MMSVPSYPPKQPIAGWYQTPYGMRWWDGAAWGPTAPPQGGTDPKTLAMLTALSVFFGSFIVPIVIMLTAGKNDSFVRENAVEALNWHLQYMFVVIGSVALFFALAFVSMTVSPGADPGVGFVLVWFAMMLLQVLFMALGVVHAVKASRGEMYRYPFLLRLVK